MSTSTMTLPCPVCREPTVRVLWTDADGAAEWWTDCDCHASALVDDDGYAERVVEAATDAARRCVTEHAERAGAAL